MISLILDVSILILMDLPFLLGKEDISYIFGYLKLELKRIDTEDVLEINDSIETNEFLEFLSRLGKNMQNKM